MLPPNKRLLLTGPSSCGASAAAALRFLRDRRGGCAAAAPQQKRRALGGRRDASQPPSLALAPTRGTTSVPGFHPITRRREELQCPQVCTSPRPWPSARWASPSPSAKHRHA